MRVESSELDEVFPQLYEELKRIAARALRGERRKHTLQPTALVHGVSTTTVKRETVMARAWLYRESSFG